MTKVRILSSIFFLFAALVWTHVAVADQAAADQAPANQVVDQPSFVEISTPEYRPYEANFEPQLGTYTYEVSWNGIPAAEALVNIGSDNFQYHVVANARLYSPINMLYNLHYRAEGTVSAIDLMPVKSATYTQESSQEKSTEINFLPNGEIDSVRTQKGQPSHVLRFMSDNQTLDPFAAAFVARGLDWKEGETRYFDTFNGKTRYLITLTAESKEQLKFNGEMRDCWVIVPTVRKLNSDESQHKLRKARIYLSADKSRDILKIVSDVFIGSVTTKLIGFQPTETPAPIRMAQARARAIIK